MTPIYTKHALSRMESRQILVDWVERVLEEPDLIEPDPVDSSLEHRLGIVPELANRVLRVIVSIEEPKRVISMYLDRNMKGQL